MVEIVKTKSSDNDFHNLIIELDKDLADRYGELQKQYEKHNDIEYIDNVVVIYKDKVPVACGGYKEYDAFTVELKRIFVLKQNRKQGLAKLVISTLENEAIDNGYRYSILETGIRQNEAIRLYKDNGYDLVQNYAPYIGNVNSICMKKVLQ